MNEHYDVPMADLTTLRVGGAARRLVTADSVDDVVTAVRAADSRGDEVLVISGGSNLVIADDGFDGTVIHIASRGITVVDDASCGGVMVTVEAGEPWDGVVARAAAEGWVGIETLSGIPGNTGATPIQNVGAYGQEVAQTIAQVRTYDRHEDTVKTFAAGDCAFGYRTSLFRHNSRYVVLSVTFQFVVGTMGAPVAYAELADALGIEVGERTELTKVREAVLALRARKGMVLDPDDADTCSAGSFFTNPILSAAEAHELPSDAPRWPQRDGTVKTSAAWLIERSGFAKGYGDDRAALSSKHTLAITNRGAATARDIVALASEIRRGVNARFGITLEPEPVFVGIEWPPAQGPRQDAS